MLHKSDQQLWTRVKWTLTPHTQLRWFAYIASALACHPPLSCHVFVAGVNSALPQAFNYVILDPKLSPHLVSAETSTWVSLRLQRWRVASEAEGCQIPNLLKMWGGPIRILADQRTHIWDPTCGQESRYTQSAWSRVHTVQKVCFQASCIWESTQSTWGVWFRGKVHWLSTQVKGVKTTRVQLNFQENTEILDIIIKLVHRGN